jgi:NAD(P)-dependent dehydrogenase (short-subunit alcohol dehydrogenase family)|nr:SDR family oxidoreductase [Kofleriaceae bacterium]
MRSRPDSKPLEARVLELAAALEELGADLAQLAALDDALRVRLVTAAGRLARPDRYSQKALGKAIHRAHKQAKLDSDRAILDGTGIRAARREPVFRTPLPQPDMALDSRGYDDAPDGWAEAEAERAAPDPARVDRARMCYACKAYFHDVHHFYDSMCGPCAELNWRKRDASTDLTGRVVMVTGGRVKIGYQAAIKLLRANAEVIVATRFPRDAARRFAREPDAAAWTQRLHVYGIDLRHTPSVELLCRHLLATQSRLDGLINNACQTVRRPAGWYDHVIVGEDADATPLERAFLERGGELAAASPSGDQALVRASDAATPAVGLWRSAVLSQLPLLAEDLERGEHLYPTHRLDQDLQQVDLRDKNTWRMTLAEVPTAELLEVQLVNAVAPFVLNGRLRPLLAAVPTRDAHVVNVSAMEGQFYRRWKTDRHPHTNMAKAALNMMTRTSAIDYVRDGIHMNSVDTGWVTDEDPLHHAERKTRVHGFHPPLDIVDGAARIVDPLFDGIATGHHLWGLFLKDYKPAPW